ncbi:hypothetical protein Q1W71_20425 [Flavobacterium pectinovorum]|nr:hypothetical protein [Flavobacterium pectinovorum]WKL47315.1 hypothetical protein Q1W71_20425 [Flavobacterium pectinovorum]
MDTLKKFEFEKLDASEMEQVQGGNWLDDVLKIIEAVVPVIGPILP